MSIAKYRKIDLVCTLVITDELSTGVWIRGFDEPRVASSKATIAEAIKKALQP
ncbi:MAG: hypothetical protein ACLFVP_01160 [Candidatus Bathyarchaeia archaeon]